MPDADYKRTEDEIDKLLNDPESPMHPHLIWDLVEALAKACNKAGDSLAMRG
jgi:predicted ATPase